MRSRSRRRAFRGRTRDPEAGRPRPGRPNARPPPSCTPAVPSVPRKSTSRRSCGPCGHSRWPIFPSCSGRRPAPAAGKDSGGYEESRSDDALERMVASVRFRRFLTPVYAGNRDAGMTINRPPFRAQRFATIGRPCTGPSTRSSPKPHGAKPRKSGYSRARRSISATASSISRPPGRRRKRRPGISPARPDCCWWPSMPNKLGSALKYEPSRGGALFPHLYAPLELAAVRWVKPLPLNAAGDHQFPVMEA